MCLCRQKEGGRFQAQSCYVIPPPVQLSARLSPSKIAAVKLRPSVFSKARRYNTNHSYFLPSPKRNHQHIRNPGSQHCFLGSSRGFGWRLELFSLPVCQPWRVKPMPRMSSAGKPRFLDCRFQFSYPACSSFLSRPLAIFWPGPTIQSVASGTDALVGSSSSSVTALAAKLVC